MATSNPQRSAAKIYVDANILIYFHEGAPEMQKLAGDALVDVLARGASIVTLPTNDKANDKALRAPSGLAIKALADRR